MSICTACREGASLMLSGNPVMAGQAHAQCPGGTHCDCQHRTDHSVLRADRQADPRRGG